MITRWLRHGLSLVWTDEDTIIVARSTVTVLNAKLILNYLLNNQCKKFIQCAMKWVQMTSLIWFGISTLLAFKQKRWLQIILTLFRREIWQKWQSQAIWDNLKLMAVFVKLFNSFGWLLSKISSNLLQWINTFDSITYSLHFANSQVEKGVIRVQVLFYYSTSSNCMPSKTVHTQWIRWCKQWKKC